MQRPRVSEGQGAADGAEQGSCWDSVVGMSIPTPQSAGVLLKHAHQSDDQADQHLASEWWRRLTVGERSKEERLCYSCGGGQGWK